MRAVAKGEDGGSRRGGGDSGQQIVVLLAARDSGTAHDMAARHLAGALLLQQFLDFCGIRPIVSFRDKDDFVAGIVLMQNRPERFFDLR